MYTRLKTLKARADGIAEQSGYAAIKDGKQDAMRHLVGSALFTKHFGVILSWLASQVSELGAWAAGHNTAAQRDMDLHNNAVARNFARRAKTEQDIIRLAHAAIYIGDATWLADDDSEPAVSNNSADGHFDSQSDS